MDIKQFTNDLDQAEREIQTRKSKLAQLDGRESEAMSRLKEKGLDTVPDAQERLVELESKKSETGEQIETVGEEIKELLYAKQS